MKDAKRTIHFENSEGEVYYIIQSPNLMFGRREEDAVIFHNHYDLIQAIKVLEHISFPYPKMVIAEA